jgi:hypothetical protein
MYADHTAYRERTQLPLRDSIKSSNAEYLVLTGLCTSYKSLPTDSYVDTDTLHER